jgi:hypothetical protein
MPRATRSTICARDDVTGKSRHRPRHCRSEALPREENSTDSGRAGTIRYASYKDRRASAAGIGVNPSMGIAPVYMIHFGEEHDMNVIKTAVAIAVGTLFAGAAFAQTAATEIQRNVNQQERIEGGLKSGQLTTREAAQLERGEAKIERMESKALSDGKLSPNEKARIERAQNAESRAIDRDTHNRAVGNPNSASSQRMQADVQRNVNEQRRIEQGIKSGQITNREAGRLERGQAHVNQTEARAGRDGHVGPHEQQRIQAAESRQSNHIYNEKHDRQTRKP